MDNNPNLMYAIPTRIETDHENSQSIDQYELEEATVEVKQKRKMSNNGFYDQREIGFTNTTKQPVRRTSNQS
jgi:hypothetical protein